MRITNIYNFRGGIKIEKFIRGFSLKTGYNCVQCHLKCCSTEYSLPLLSNEEKILSKNYPAYQTFFDKKKSKSYLVRGDRCIFLDNRGLCVLHDINLKPLACEIYPLIFWKINQNEILVWLNPCRGHGFSWVAQRQFQISNSKINSILTKSTPYFHEYWGEDLDINNPFSSISKQRIEEEIQFYNSNSNHKILEKVYDIPYVRNFYNQSFSSLFDFNTLYSHSDLAEVINSVLTWLIWSPVGLQLSFENAKCIFLISSLWIGNQFHQIMRYYEENLNREDYLHQLGSLMARSIHPSFWQLIYNETPSSALRAFSERIYQVLIGNLPQEQLFKG